LKKQPFGRYSFCFDLCLISETFVSSPGSIFFHGGLFHRSVSTGGPFFPVSYRAPISVTPFSFSSPPPPSDPPSLVRSRYSTALVPLFFLLVVLFYVIFFLPVFPRPPPKVVWFETLPRFFSSTIYFLLWVGKKGYFFSPLLSPYLRIWLFLV